MNKQQKYALFDWDNTIRSGYTLYSWVDYLCECNVIDEELLLKLEILKQQYIKKIITHDQYADRACIEYTKALTGKKVDEINQLINNYIKRDRKLLFSQMRILLKKLAEREIDIIVISGAPFRILEQYRQDLHLKEIYASFFKKRKLLENLRGK